MKYRQGYVSNSSSSSFIIGIGVVADEKKFQEACKNQNLSIDDKQYNSVKIKPLSQILADATEGGWYDYPRIQDTKLVIESFRGDEATLDFSTLDGDTLIAYMDVTGELDGDSDFYVEDCWDMQYDLSPTENDMKKMSVFSKENGIINSSTIAGAGRDG